jgi:hypothetical protein
MYFRTIGYKHVDCRLFNTSITGRMGNAGSSGSHEKMGPLTSWVNTALHMATKLLINVNVKIVATS